MTRNKKFKAVCATTKKDLYDEQFSENDLREMKLSDDAELFAPSISKAMGTNRIGTVDGVFYDEDANALIASGTIDNETYLTLFDDHWERLRKILTCAIRYKDKTIDQMLLTTTPVDYNLMDYEIELEDE